MGRISDKAILEIVEHIYTAGCDPAEWPAVAARCQSLHPGCGFNILIELDGAKMAPILAAIGYDPDYVASYVAHYHQINPYEDVLRRIPVGKVTKATEVVTRDWLERQPFYHEWLKPAGDFTAGASVTLFRSPQLYARACIDIPDTLAGLEQSAAEFLERIRLHLARALDITVRLNGERVLQTGLDAMLERLTWPALVVDQSGRIFAANGGALRLLRAGELVKQLPNSRLAFLSTGSNELFQSALSSLGSISPGATSASFAVRSANGAHPVHVLPLARAARYQQDPSRLAMVLIGTNQRRPHSPSPILRSLYGLTPAEATIVQRLAAGQSIKELADESGVALATARNQLASAMSKLEVRRQAELVAMVATLTPSFEPGVSIER